MDISIGKRLFNPQKILFHRRSGFIVEAVTVIVEQGVKKDVLAPPHHEYTELLLSSVPEMDPDWLDGVLAMRKRKGIKMEELVQSGQRNIQ